MSYREENGQVILTMSREDYSKLMGDLGRAMALRAKRGGAEDASAWLSRMKEALEWLDRLNDGNPNYRPYQAKK